MGALAELPRPLTPEEQDILDFLIAANPRHAVTMRRLLRRTEVVRECQIPGCGCGSIFLSTNRSVTEKRTWPFPLAVTGEADMSEEGMPPEKQAGDCKPLCST